MTDFMADWFLLARLVDPELDARLYATMLSIFFRGLQAMAAGWEHSEAEMAARAGS